MQSSKRHLTQPIPAEIAIGEITGTSCFETSTLTNSTMAAPRLPFLWPVLFRPATASSSRVRASISKRDVLARKACRQLTTASHCRDAPNTQRYGAAYEHKPTIGESFVPAKDEQSSNAPAKKPAQEQKLLEEPANEEAEEEEEHATATSPTIPSKVNTVAEENAPPVPPPDPPKTGDAKPLDSVLHMPSTTQEEEHKPPHLKTPPYVHHFDTYGLVQELNKSTYTPEQSIYIMKAVRQILLDNMALARAGLVSKSSVENETYLFRAACSELKTEIGNTRKGEIERMRTERNQLHHEVDILGQRLGQETGNLKDELKGLFDDRKMAVRQEQRSMETKVLLTSSPLS